MNGVVGPVREHAGPRGYPDQASPAHSPLSFIITLIMSGRNTLPCASSVWPVNSWVTHLSWSTEVPLVPPLQLHQSSVLGCLNKNTTRKWPATKEWYFQKKKMIRKSKKNTLTSKVMTYWNVLLIVEFIFLFLLKKWHGIKSKKYFFFYFQRSYCTCTSIYRILFRFHNVTFWWNSSIKLHLEADKEIKKSQIVKVRFLFKATARGLFIFKIILMHKTDCVFIKG